MRFPASFLFLGICHRVMAKRYLYGAVPEPAITVAATLDGLVERGIATCGYVSGNGAYPLTCAAGYTCTDTVQDFVGWACCNAIDCPGDWRVCQDYGAEALCGNLGDAECSSIYTSILTCSSANPSCFSYARSASLGASNTYYSLACGQASTQVLVLATTTGGANQAAPTSTNLFATETTDFNAFPTQTGSSGTSGSSGSGSTSNSSGTHSNTWKIIVACVIVGVVLIAVGGIVGCVWWRRHHRQINQYKNPGVGHPQDSRTWVTPSTGGTTIANWNADVVDGPPPPGPPPPPSNYGGSTVYSHSMSDFGRRY